MDVKEIRKNLLETQFGQLCKEVTIFHKKIKRKLAKKSSEELKQMIGSWEEYTKDKSISEPVSILFAKKLLQLREV